MRTLKRFVVSLCTGSILLSPSFAVAQGTVDNVSIGTLGGSYQVDSFFDVFTEIELPDIQCDPCQALRDEMDTVQEEITEAKAQLLLIDSMIGMIDDAVRASEKELGDLEKQLEEMENPKNYVESEGRRYDSSDHAAMQRRTANLWRSYKDGDVSAQEYSDEVGKPFDDPDVARELEKLKKEIKEELADRIDDLRNDLEDAKSAKDDLNEMAAELTATLEALLDELEELMRELEDCLKRCKEEAVNIPEDYGIGQDPKGFIDSFFDIFTEIFNPPPTLDWLDDLIEQLDEEPPSGGGGSGGSGDPAWDELMDLIDQLDEDTGGGGSGGGGEPAIDSFFDVFFEIDLPSPVCHLCDPIREQIMETEASLNDMLQEQAMLDAEVDQLYRDLQTASDVKRNAQDALDRLNNPPSYAESDGRRMDSSDQAAMRVRNARLWADYKSGDLSAQELSDEWGKPFDDPEVQDELNDIKENMKDELQDAIDEAQDAIDDINEAITAKNDRLVELAGLIAAHRAVLEYLYRDLEECEKRCRLVDEFDPESFIPDFGDLIFPENFVIGDVETDGEDEEEQEDIEDRDEVGEEVINVPQECVSPAVPMSQCERTCVQTCTKSGVRAWQEGNTVYIEDCGICPPPQIELCPTGTYVDKAQCEGDNKCECEEKSKLSDGASCYGCKQKEQKFGCALPLFGDFFCEKEEGYQGGTRVAVGDVNGDGFLCDWFKLGCLPGLDLRDVAECMTGEEDSEDCSQLDANHDGAVNLLDLNEFKLSLQGPNGFNVPLQINGMDGNDTLTLDDVGPFSRCLLNGGPACDDLIVGSPPPDFFGGTPPDVLLGTGPGDLGLHMTNGNDILIRNPITPNFFGNDGLTFDGGPNPPPIPDDFFSGGPNGGVQLFGPGGNTIPNPPPLPPSNEQEVVQRLVNEALARLRNEPLGPCEKFVVTVIRQRIGNTTRYIVRVTKVRDEAKCPSQCPPQTSFQAIFPPTPESCRELCQNGGGGCSVIATLQDGTQCVMCGPPVDDQDTGGALGGDPGGCPPGTYDDFNVCNSQCLNTQGCRLTGLGIVGIGRQCYACPPGSGEEDGLLIPGTPVTPGSSSSSEACPDLAYATESACRSACTQGTCESQRFGSTQRVCWMCVDRGLQCPQGQYGTRAACDLACPSRTSSCARDSRTGCYLCRTATGTSSSSSIPSTVIEDDQQDCPNGSVKSCGECPSNTECQEDHDGCLSCEPKTASCPSGTTSSKSACEEQCGAQGGTCSADNNGCYSCTVLNCPSGTYKNECPSSCSNGCDIAAEQSGVKCYKCKQDCETVCAQNDYGGPNTDHSSAILSELNGYTCVSGASISIQTATINGCQCIGQYSISVDTTPPVCKGTPCGDVTCGGSAQCTEGDTTITVNCNWGGWQKIDKHQFRPVVGN